MRLSLYTSQHPLNRALACFLQALSINPQDAIATYLLELCLPEQVDSGAYGFPGLPEQLTQDDLDPFDGLSQNRLLNLPIYLHGTGMRAKEKGKEGGKGGVAGGSKSTATGKAVEEREESMDFSRDVSVVAEEVSRREMIRERLAREEEMDMDLSMTMEESAEEEEEEEEEDEDDGEAEGEGESGAMVGGETVSMEEDSGARDGSTMDFD